MISCESFFNILKKKGFNFYTGIPDSTFKDWMNFLADNDAINLQNVVACNECEAIALAAGFNLATNKVGLVYMQNSGLGKAINPLVSLCDPEVYSIPILLMIGWRGEPGKIDAPQHKKMGKITLPLLETLKIPYSILEPNLSLFERELNKAINYFEKNEGPYAFIIRKNFFSEYDVKKKPTNNNELIREDVIKFIMENLDGDEIIVSSTGYTSRELFEYRESTKKDHHKIFYNIGSMGCASSIGLSISIQRKERVIIFDGDGAAIMQMGAFSTIGEYSPPNLVHIIFDNQVHESTGNQPTNSPSANFIEISHACNYESSKLIKTKDDLYNAIPYIKEKKGPILLLIKIKISSRSNLKRPDKLPKEYKEGFVKHLTEEK